MFEFRDLFQWERFVTPSIIKIFYWLAVAIIVLVALWGVLSGVAFLKMSPGSGGAMILTSLLGMMVGIIFARIAAEFVLIVFRINEHLGAIRAQAEQAGR